MRNENLELPKEEAEKILAKMSYGTLAINGNDGYPYSVPVYFIYTDGKIYFHGAKAGKKYDALLENNKAAFSVIESECIVPKKRTSFFKSAMAFGTVKIIEDKTVKKNVMVQLLKKISEGINIQGAVIGLTFAVNSFAVFEFTVEHLTGKEKSA
jgi:nitroimidazol reductase NimA-like FMN-containing flavoprotein (pyridoxamine 5'-phosphate oxidase superfamily)